VKSLRGSVVGACLLAACVRPPGARQEPTRAATAEPPSDAGAASTAFDAADAALAEEVADAAGSVDDAKPSIEARLAALHIGEDNWAQRTVYTWTTHEQVEAMRTSRTLLVATARTRGPPSPFVFGIDTLSRRRGPSGALAKLLADGPRFAKRRYAWKAAYATVLGLAAKRYGDQLVSVRLRENAWVVHFDPQRDPPLRVRDLQQREIALDEALLHAEYIGAVYHVRSGRDTPVPFREYVLVNEAAIERWAVATPDVRAEVAAEGALLRDLRAAIEHAPGLVASWKATLAFENDRYGKLDARHLDATIAGLASYDATPAELEVRPP
jgi:hypothetical protein